MRKMLNVSRLIFLSLHIYSEVLVYNIYNSFITDHSLEKFQLYQLQV